MVGSADAHRRKRQRSRGPTHPVRQAEVVIGALKPSLKVIQNFSENLNICIKKTPESACLYDYHALFSSFPTVKKAPQSRTAWGPFCERKTSKMCPHGGWRQCDLTKRRTQQRGGSSVTSARSLKSRLLAKHGGLAL